jgi:ABC-2 type transport system permease protein
VLSALLSLLLMNIVSRSRHRDLITTIGSVILIIGVIGGQNYIMSRVPGNEQDFMMGILKSSNALIGFVGRAFPPSVWVTKILSAGGVESLVNLLYLLFASLVSFAAVYFLASFIYHRGAVASLEIRSKSGKTRLTYGSSTYAMTIFKNEWRILLRTPVYTTNALVVIFMAPLLMMMPMFGGNFAKDPDLKFLFELIQSRDSQPELLLIVAGIIALLCTINPAISTTVSREGKNIWILKNIPVEPEVQVYGKFLAGYSISFIAAALSAVMTMFSFKISPLLTLMILVLSSLASIPACAISLYIDLVNPKLIWSNPTEAIKQNMNSLFAMLVSFLIISLFGVIGYFLGKTDLNVYAIFGIMLLILLIASAASMKVLRKAAKNSYHRIEV